MLVELKDKSQVTIPKAVISELGLKRGDMFDIVVDGGSIVFVPVVVYPKKQAEELEELAAKARSVRRRGDAVIYDDVEDLISDLHAE